MLLNFSSVKWNKKALSLHQVVNIKWTNARPGVRAQCGRLAEHHPKEWFTCTQPRADRITALT
jgi:hypothetical protein